MKITATLVLVCCLHASAAVHAQRISLNGKHIPLKRLFSEIRQQSGYTFAYAESLLHNVPAVSVNISNATIEQALEHCLRNQPLTWMIVDKTVVIRSRPAGNTGLEKQETLLLRRINGRVTDSDGNPLIGVTVQVKGTSTGTTTGMEGRFSLEVPDNAVLVFSYVGYDRKEISVENRTGFDIALSQASTGLNQVVVIGYGSQKRSDVTGAISSVKGADVGRQAIANPVQALTGLAAGVQTVQNSGAPGSELSVRVRGDNSLLGGNEPLYVVDGFPYAGALNNINPNDILSIEVLKDASSTAIYGSRGSNGVVMITTRKGRPGKTVIEYNGYYGWQRVAKTLDLLNAREFATLANTRAANDNIAPYFTDEQLKALGEGTDWQRQIFRTAPIQNHSLRISGGNEKTVFDLSGSYLNQQGIILGSEFNQGQLRTNLSHKINERWKIDFNGIFSRTVNDQLNSDNQERGLGVLSGMLVAPPTLPVKNPDGAYTNLRVYPFSPDILENPVAMALERKQSNATNALLSNVALSWKIARHLDFRTSAGVQYNMTRADFYSPTIFQQTANGSAAITYSEQMHIVNENLLTYTRQFGSDHKLVLLGGLTNEKISNQSANANSRGFSSNTLGNNSLQSGTIPGTPVSGYDKYTLLSWLGRANYSYRDKYLLTASIRADGSSRFGSSNKWGYFPSVAGAWRVSEERFWSGLKYAISDFKIRGSWGETGNTAVSPYQSLSVLSGIPTVFDDNLYVGFAPGNVKPNPDLKWETTTQVDIGADIGLLGGRIALSFDYYRKMTRDLLASVPLPLSSGYITQSANIGSIRNSGVDLALDLRIADKGKFSWDLGGTFTVNRNTVTSLANGADIFGVGMGNNLPAMSLVRVGQPIGVFYGYVEDGLTKEGNIRYKDLDGSGDITTADRTIIGNPNPKFIAGLNSRISYGNFGFSFIISCIQGNDILAYNLTSIANGFYFGENQLRDVLGNYWTPERPDAKYPRVSSATRYLGSDRFIKDGSYIRLRNIQLSYSLKGSRMKAMGINHAEVYASAQNLFTITNYPLYSPDISTRGAGISKGIDEMGYPDARTVMIGLRMSF